MPVAVQVVEPLWKAITLPLRAVDAEVRPVTRGRDSRRIVRKSWSTPDSGSR